MSTKPRESKGRVTGIGGFFFNSQQPEVLGQWYQTMLGVELSPQSYDERPWRTEAGTTIFQPFPEGNDYFTSLKAGWMINFRVDDLDAIVERLRAAEHPVEYEGDGEAFPNGRFATLSDPEGNAIQLWEPGGCDPG